MGLDSRKQVGSAAIVEEEDTLARTPEWRGTELIAIRLALGDTVSKRAHRVHLEVAVWAVSDRAQLAECGESRRVLRDVAQGTAGLGEPLPTAVDAAVGRRRRWRLE